MGGWSRLGPGPAWLMSCQHQRQLNQVIGPLLPLQALSKICQATTRMEPKITCNDGKFGEASGSAPVCSGHLDFFIFFFWSCINVFSYTNVIYGRIGLHLLLFGKIYPGYLGSIRYIFLICSVFLLSKIFEMGPPGQYCPEEGPCTDQQLIDVTQKAGQETP